MSPSDLEHLLARITALEDRLAILDLLAGSAHSSDVASEPFWHEMFAEDAIMDRGSGRAADVGREAILDIVRGAGQRDAVANGMSHLAMLPRITIAGDRAVATGYLLVVVPNAEAAPVMLPGKGPSLRLSIYHLTINEWMLSKTGDGWKITTRTIRPLATDDGRRILAGGLAPIS